MKFSEEEKAMRLEDWRQSGKSAWTYAVESLIIPKSIVTPGLLSGILTQKFEDHLPYYRQEIPYASSPGDWEKLLPWNIFTP